MPDPDLPENAMPHPVAIELMGAFAVAWENVERPDAVDYLACAAEHGDGCRVDLAELITSYMTWAPTPNYSPEQLQCILEEARRLMRGGGG